MPAAHSAAPAVNGISSRHSPAAAMMPPMRDDLQRTWAVLEDGVQRIMTRLEDGLEMSRYMAVYTSVHNYCTTARHNPSRAVPLGVGAPGPRGGADLLGEDLYRQLRAYLVRHLKGVRNAAKPFTDEQLLLFYVKEWHRFTRAAKYINHLFKYLNRHWIKRELEEGKRDTYEVFTLHLVEWRELVFKELHEGVMNAVLQLVHKQRLGDTIDQSHIKTVVDSFLEIGTDEQDSSKTTTDVYREYFSKPYTEDAKKFYDAESAQFLAEHPVTEYMTKAESRLAEEEARASTCLNRDILQSLLLVCTNSLIKNHSAILIEEFRRLLEGHRKDDLARTYRLLSRVGTCMPPLRQALEAHIKKTGLEAVAKVAGEGDAMEPKAYVDALLEVHARYSQLVVESFGNDVEFIKSLDNACGEFVNRNSITAENPPRSSELLAKYTDSLLKKSGKAGEEADVEVALNQVMTVFRFIEDKDVFQKFYSKMLARRLVNTTSTSDEAEVLMIAKLKEACGFEYTSKLQRMFQDMQTSADLNDNYKTWVANLVDDDPSKRTIDSTYAILGTSFWPLSPQNTPFTVPGVLASTLKDFETFYMAKHSGRKLQWLWHLCKGEMKASYIKNTKVPYTFQVSTYQMALLLLFNEKDKVSYEEMESATQLSKEILDPSIGIFVKAKVVLATPPGKVESGSTFALNYDFKHKKYKVSFNISIKSEQKQESEETHKTIEEDRKLLMQSVIVRIMKSRKKMKHVELVTETIAQIKSRFTPKVQDIKKCIETLIEKDYLERLEGGVMGYLA